MSHYLEDAEARAVDKLALAPLAAADPRGLYDTVRTHGISMCGYIPATVATIAARALGARAPRSSATPPAPTPAPTAIASSATPPSASTRDLRSPRPSSSRGLGRGI